MRSIDEELHRAVELTRPEEVRFLLERGADVHSVGHAYGPILVLAARKSMGDDTICRMLIDAGADVAAEEAGESVLTSLVRWNHLELVREVIKRGANVHGRADGITPLGQLHSDDQLEIAKLLVAEGADPNKCGKYLSSLLSKVAGRGAQQLCAFLLETGKLNVLDHPEALLEAAECGNVEIARMLVERGLSSSWLPEDSDFDHLTPFQTAVKKGYAPLVQFFIDECGEDLAQRTNAGKTMLQLAKSDEVKVQLRAAKTAKSIGAAVPSGGEGDSRAGATRRRDLTL